jgi:hypothetical protein
LLVLAFDLISFPPDLPQGGDIEVGKDYGSADLEERVDFEALKQNFDAWDDLSLDESDEKPWKQARLSSSQRKESVLTFDKWHDERQAQLEHDILASKAFYDEPRQNTVAPLSQTYTNIFALDDPSSGDDDDKGKRRPNIREHSKAQREKKKAFITELETSAMTLTEQLNSSTLHFRSQLDKANFRHKYCFETLKTFLTLWISGESRLEPWQSLVDVRVIEMVLPMTRSRFTPPGQCIGNRRSLRGLTKITADSISIAHICSTISNLGLIPICVFTLTMDLTHVDFYLEGDVAFCPFLIVSNTAILCGGEHEIRVKGISFFSFCLDLKFC